MKSIAALLSLIAVTTSAFASNGYNVKVSDGGTAHCKSKADVFRDRFGAYQPRLKSIVVDRDIAEVKIETSFLSCVENDGKFQFTAVKPYDLLTYQVVTFDNGIQTISAKPELIKMISYRDGVYKKIADVELTNNHKQIVTFKLKLDDLLTAQEQVELEDGKTVVGNFDYALQKMIKVDGEDKARRISFGAFRIHFKAVLDRNNTLKIIAL